MNKITFTVSNNGSQLWFKNGKHGRKDGPAEIFIEGSRFWYKNDKWHRDDGPSEIYINGMQFWNKNGMIHYGMIQ